MGPSIGLKRVKVEKVKNYAETEKKIAKNLFIEIRTVCRTLNEYNSKTATSSDNRYYRLFTPNIYLTYI